MKARIVLLDGVVIEADGTAQEIADLTAALRRSHQIAQIDDKDAAPSGVVSLGNSGRNGVSAGSADLDDEYVSESLGGAEEHGQAHSELDEGRGFETEEDDEPPEAVVSPSVDKSGTSGPPLDLVVRDVAEQFRLLADRTRLQILTVLSDGEHNVGELCESLGGMSQPAVSHHLALLRLSGLVRPNREGKFNYYDLTEQGRTLTEAVSRLGDWDGNRAIVLLRQASDTTRLQILVTLSEGDRNVGELCSDLGGMSQPAVSHHLALLRHGGLVETRRAGKFSYYSLRREGRDLTLLVAPMMGARARADTGPAGDTFEAEAIDFSDIPDDWMHEPPHDDDMGNGDESGSGGAPPAHMLCRRVLVMVQELHRRGYEQLRVAPGISPSGLHWRCSIVPVDWVRRDHGALAVGGGVLAACYGSGQGARFFDWPDAEHDAPVALAGKFLDRFPDIASRGRGSDPEYARWYAGMLRATAPDGLIYAYADWDLPEDHIPVLGCTSEVKIPLPPPGGAESGG
jgi:DNA-binding transcriptional ArsR family regulator